MQLDMHYYATYALARAAGIPADQARIIAHADQYVDDSLEDFFETFESAGLYLPVMSSHKPLDYRNCIPGSDQWRVWVSFHFLPGNRGDGPEQRLVCRRGDDRNALAVAMLDYVMEHKNEKYGLHLAGIASHVFQDTFAHYGFSGFTCDLNRVRQGSIKSRNVEKGSNLGQYIWGKARLLWKKAAAAMAEEASKLGHGGVATFPDRPYLEWEYEYEVDWAGPVRRKNWEDYLDACERQYDFYTLFASENANILRRGPVKPFADIKDVVEDLLRRQDKKEDRVHNWKEAMSEGKLFDHMEPADRTVEYRELLWGTQAAGEHFKSGGSPETCDTCLFMKAARKYRDFVLRELLPGNDLVI